MADSPSSRFSDITSGAHATGDESHKLFKNQLSQRSSQKNQRVSSNNTLTPASEKADGKRDAKSDDAKGDAVKNDSAKPDNAKPESAKGSTTTDRSKSASKSKSKHEQRVVSRGIAPCLAWVDREVPIKAVIVCVHGLGLHNGTYEAFGKRMASSGFATYAIDVRGFGAWMQAEGKDRVDFDHCLNDVRTTLKVVRRAHPGLPVFLVGESMGGAIALRVTSLYPELVDGLISSVPAGDRFKQAKTSFKVGFHLLKNPNKPINVGEGVVKQATQKEDLRKNWLEDPLNKIKLSPRELVQFQTFMNGNHDAAKNIVNTAVLIVQGCQDKLVRPEGTVELFNHLGTADRQIVLIPNAEHLIFEEAQFTDEDIATVTSWITAHLPKQPSTEIPKSEEKKSDSEEKSDSAIK